MTEDPKKVFGTQDAYDQRVVLRVTQGHTGCEGDSLMILGVYGPDVDTEDGISGKTVRLRPKSVEMMAVFIADYLGKEGLPTHQPRAGSWIPRRRNSRVWTGVCAWSHA